MPFNRVNNTKAINLWLLVLSAYKPAKKEKRFAKSEFPGDDEANKPPACWCPGMMVVPLPQAGWFLGYWDMGYWAALFYVLGSIVYVIDSFYLWPYFYPASNDDPADPGVYWNTVASSLFVINALLCFLDWYMQREQLSVMNMIVDESVTGGFQLQSVSTKITWYYFFNNFFFLGAAVVFLIQAIWMENYDWDIYHCSDGLCGEFWMNFWGNFLYVISSVFAFLEYWEDKKIRHQQGLPPLTLLPYTWESFDWFGWGDILYVATSVLQTLQPFFMFSSRITEDFNDGFYLNANIFFLIDSLAYFIGYVIFLFDMRRALYSGQVPINQTGAIRDMIGDAMHLDTRASSERSISGGSIDYPVFRRVEYGYVSIEEIREKLLAARDIRAHRASDPTGRMLPATNRITPIQATIAQRKSETSFSSYLNRPVSVDNLVKWGAKSKSTPIKEETEDETAMLLTESLLPSPDP